MTELVANINDDVAGVTAALGSNGELILSNDTGAAIVISNDTNDAADITAAGLIGNTYFGYLSLSSIDGSEIELDIDRDDATMSMSALHDFGFNASNGSGEASGDEVDGNAITSLDSIVINDVELGTVIRGNDSTLTITAADVAFAINEIKDQTGVSATASTVVDVEIDMTVAITATDFVSAVTLNGVNFLDSSISGTAVTALTSINNLITAINNSGIEGVQASLDPTDGDLRLTSDVGVTIELVQTTSTSLFTGIGTGSTTRGVLSLENDEGGDIIITSNATTISAGETALAKVGLVAQGGSEQAIGLGLSVTTVENANVALSRIDDALDTVSSVRANLGAFQNRLGSTISNLENVTQNLSSANSRIKDADFATETSQLTKSQILQQAGIAMLAQANASQQNVLSLLG